MSFTFPAFASPITIDGGTWTATFDSYDQRLDACYYVVMLRDAAGRPTRLVAQVPLWWAGEDWTAPDFVERLLTELHAVAQTGRSNTEYSA